MSQLDDLRLYPRHSSEPVLVLECVLLLCEVERQTKRVGDILVAKSLAWLATFERESAHGL